MYRTCTILSFFFSDRRDEKMSFSCAYYLCSCREHHNSVVGHCFWFVQNCGENGWWPIGCRWRRHDERHSSREKVEWPRFDDSDDQDDKWPRFDGSDDQDDDRFDMGRDGEPLYANYIGTPMKLIFYWEECCERCNYVPKASDSVPRGSARGVHRNRRDFVDDEKYESDGGEVMSRANVRKPPSVRRQRTRLVRGGDWF